MPSRFVHQELPQLRGKCYKFTNIDTQFSYCPLVWMFCSKKLNEKINRIQERSLRMVYLDYTSSYEELLKKDGSVTIHQKNVQLVALEMFKIVNNIGPQIMRSLVEFKPGIRYDENGNVIGNMFVRPKVKTEYMGKGSFRYFRPVLWDELLPS